jgi:hypothetical protein
MAYISQITIQKGGIEMAADSKMKMSYMSQLVGNWLM